MCGVYNAFETEGAIIDESSYYILNQYGHKKLEYYFYVMEGYSQKAECVLFC